LLSYIKKGGTYFANTHDEIINTLKGDDLIIEVCEKYCESSQSSQGRKPTTLEWWEECPF